jgi:hypothetical protein
MKTQTTPQNRPTTEPKKNFLGSLFTRIDQAMKRAAEKKAQDSCCCSGSDDDSGSSKGGKCC